MTPDAYLDGIGQRLAADGCAVTRDRIGPIDVVVGYRKDFLPIALSRLHLVTVAGSLPEVTGPAVVQFARDVSQYAKSRSGALRGMQSGVGAFSILVSDRVTPDAVQAAQAKAKLEFAVRVQPAVVDTAAGVVHTFTGSQLFGAALNGHLRRKRELYVTAPTG